VVKVSKGSDGKVKIDKVGPVMDCGWFVNPDIVRAQVEGSIVMALGAAVTHETHFSRRQSSREQISIRTKCLALMILRRLRFTLWKTMKRPAVSGNRLSLRLRQR
jgi:hypothetical protein